MKTDTLTTTEQEWVESNVESIKTVPMLGVDYTMLILKNGNIVLGQTTEEAVRMEMNQTGVEMEIDVEEELMNYLRREV